MSTQPPAAQDAAPTSPTSAPTRKRWRLVLLALVLLLTVGGAAFAVDRYLDYRADQTAKQFLADVKIPYAEKWDLFQNVAELDSDRARIAVLEQTRKRSHESGFPLSEHHLRMLVRAAVGLDPNRREKARAIFEEYRKDDTGLVTVEFCRCLSRAEKPEAPKGVPKVKTPKPPADTRSAGEIGRLHAESVQCIARLARPLPYEEEQQALHVPTIWVDILTTDEAAFVKARLLERSRDKKAPAAFRVECVQKAFGLDLVRSKGASPDTLAAFTDFVTEASAAPLLTEMTAKRPAAQTLEEKLLRLLPRVVKYLSAAQKASVVKWAQATENRVAGGRRTADFLAGLYLLLPEQDAERVKLQLIDRLSRYAALDESSDNPFQRQKIERDGKMYWSPHVGTMLQFLTRLEELKDRVTPEESALIVRAIVSMTEWDIAAQYGRELHTGGQPGDIVIEDYDSRASPDADVLREEVSRIAVVFGSRVAPHTAHALAGQMLERLHPLVLSGNWFFPFDSDFGLTFAALLTRAEDADLVDLLKQPRCVTQAEYIVLAELGRRRKTSFRNVWDFVDYAKTKEPAIDLRRPPRRPKWAPG